MLRFAFLLVLVATAALAAGYDRKPTLSPTSMTWIGDRTISTKTDQTLVLRRARLVDKAGRAYDLSGEPVGITWTATT